MTLETESLERTSPGATADLGQARSDLDRFGYAIVKDVLTPKDVAALRSRTVEQAAGEEAAGVAWRDSKTNQRLWMLINKGRVYRDLVLHPLADEMMGYLLGDDFLLSSATANIAAPGGDPMNLHTDQLYVGFWTPKPVVANIAWMLDDFSDENGGTRVTPGSHLKPDWRAELATPTVAAEGPAGSALVFDGRLIHGTGANRTRDQRRHAILTYYCRPFMRQQENFFLGLDPALETPANEALLKRLGYTIQYGLGRIEKPTETGLLSRGRGALAALDAQGRPLAAAS